MTKHDVDAIAGAIASYLDLHPDAADSAESIQRWWLSSEFHDEALETVCLALGALESRKIVERAMLEGGRAIYRRARPRSQRG